MCIRDKNPISVAFLFIEVVYGKIYGKIHRRFFKYSEINCNAQQSTGGKRRGLYVIVTPEPTDQSRKPELPNTL